MACVRTGPGLAQPRRISLRLSWPAGQPGRLCARRPRPPATLEGSPGRATGHAGALASGQAIGQWLAGSLGPPGAAAAGRPAGHGRPFEPSSLKSGQQARTRAARPPPRRGGSAAPAMSSPALLGLLRFSLPSALTRLAGVSHSPGASEACPGLLQSRGPGPAVLNALCAGVWHRAHPRRRFLQQCMLHRRGELCNFHRGPAARSSLRLLLTAGQAHAGLVSVQLCVKRELPLCQSCTLFCAVSQPTAAEAGCVAAGCRPDPSRGPLPGSLAGGWSQPGQGPHQSAGRPGRRDAPPASFVLG